MNYSKASFSKALQSIQPSMKPPQNFGHFKCRFLYI